MNGMSKVGTKKCLLFLTVSYRFSDSRGPENHPFWFVLTCTILVLYVVLWVHLVSTYLMSWLMACSSNNLIWTHTSRLHKLQNTKMLAPLHDCVSCRWRQQLCDFNFVPFGGISWTVFISVDYVRIYRCWELCCQIMHIISGYACMVSIRMK